MRGSRVRDLRAGREADIALEIVAGERSKGSLALFEYPCSGALAAGHQAVPEGFLLPRFVKVLQGVDLFLAEVVHVAASAAEERGYSRLLVVQARAQARVLLGLGREEHVVVERCSKTVAGRLALGSASQSASSDRVRGSVSETIWFSTERNSMSAIGAMKVTSTKIRSGAISISARISARAGRGRLRLSGVPSAEKGPAPSLPGALRGFVKAARAASSGVGASASLLSGAVEFAH